MEYKEQLICQSCGMPLTDEYFASNADGSVNHEYCSYCCKDGEFTHNMSMDEVIELNLEYLEEFNKDSDTKFTPDEARAEMKKFFPTLKRWQA